MTIFQKIMRLTGGHKRDHIVTDKYGRTYLLRMSEKKFENIVVLSEEDSDKRRMDTPEGVMPIEAIPGYKIFFPEETYPYSRKKGCLTPAGVVFGKYYYDVIGPCNGCLLLVKNGKEYFYVNRDGQRQVMPPIPYCQRMVLHEETGFSSFMYDSKWGLCDKDSKIIFDAVLDSNVFYIEPDTYSEGYVVVRFLCDYQEHMKNRRALLNVEEIKRGKIVLSQDWSLIHPFKNGTAHVVTIITMPGEEADPNSLGQHYIIDKNFNTLQEWWGNDQGEVDEVRHYRAEWYDRDDSILDAFEGDEDLYNEWLLNS